MDTRWCWRLKIALFFPRKMTNKVMRQVQPRDGRYSRRHSRRHTRRLTAFGHIHITVFVFFLVRISPPLPYEQAPACRLHKLSKVIPKPRRSPPHVLNPNSGHHRVVPDVRRCDMHAGCVHRNPKKYKDDHTFKKHSVGAGAFDF